MPKSKVLRTPKAGVSLKDAGVSLEDRIASALEWLEKFPILPTGHMSKAAKKFDVTYVTLWRRYTGRSTSRSRAHESQKLLSKEQEEVLTEWLKHWAREGRPISRRMLRVKVKIITKTVPSWNWIDRFRSRHPDLCLATPRKLAPERAKCFNPTTVSEHFQGLREVLDKYQFKAHNIYNMDEKGCQMGGGRTRSNKKAFFAHDDQARYQLRSDELELVTILECVSADGTSIAPGFIFAGGSYDLDWFKHGDLPLGNGVT